MLTEFTSATAELVQHFHTLILCGKFWYSYCWPTSSRTQQDAVGGVGNFTRLIITIPLEKKKKKETKKPLIQLKKTKETILYALAYHQIY